MLAGVNDGYAQAVQLAQLLDPRIYKVNLIPYNPTDSIYDGSSRDAIDAFKAALEEHGLRATVRLTRGRDIDAPAASSPRQAARRTAPVSRPHGDAASPARQQRGSRERRARASSGDGSHCSRSGSSSTERRPNSFRNSGVVRYSTAPNCERPASSIRPRSSSARGRGLDADAADASDLRPRDRLQVGDDRQRLGLRGVSGGVRGLRQQPPRGLLGLRVRGERPAAADLPQHDAAAVQAVAQLGQRVEHRPLVLLGGVAQVVERDRLGREEQQRLDDPGQRRHDGLPP